MHVQCIVIMLLLCVRANFVPKYHFPSLVHSSSDGILESEERSRMGRRLSLLSSANAPQQSISFQNSKLDYKGELLRQIHLDVRQQVKKKHFMSIL